MSHIYNYINLNNNKNYVRVAVILDSKLKNSVDPQGGYKNIETIRIQVTYDLIEIKDSNQIIKVKKIDELLPYLDE